MRKELPIAGSDKFHDECAVFGIYGHKEAANLTYLGLYALQHRGQEASGIVSADGDHFHVHKGMGLVADIYNTQTLKNLTGSMAIGHNRYSTAGGQDLKNVQPLTVNFAFGNLALAHNGNLINAQVLRNELEAYGAIFQSTSDSEVIIHLIAHSRADTLLARVIDALSQVRGAFSVVLLTDEGIIAARDPYGFRPLSLGKLRDTYLVASETCAFDLLDAEIVREIEPGELVVLNENGVTSYKPFSAVQPAMCIFEYVYFARPDSKIFGANAVYATRKALGRQLAQESWVPADLVIPVPDSGVPAALGYSEGAGIPFETGLIRNHYVGRTFIQPAQSVRELGVRMKHSANRAAIAGKRIILIDDSLVRGTTSRKIVRMMRDAGATEVHFRLASPPIIHPDYYGIDLPDRSGLLAATHSLEQMRDMIGADSLAFLSIDGMYRAMGEPGRDPANPKYSDHCFTGAYPTNLTDHTDVEPQPHQLSLLAEAS